MSTLNIESSSLVKVKKVLRSLQINGFSRTLIKLIGRIRASFMKLLSPFLFVYLGERKRLRKVSFVGCGQASFTCIAFFLKKYTRARFLSCMDINRENSNTFSRFYGIEESSSDNASEFFSKLNSDLVYVATNHASHADYAIRSMEKGADVYVEKPLVVEREQLLRVAKVKKETGREIFVGYNRPFSKAVRKLKEIIGDKSKPISLNFFIIGHFIPEDHWYRNPEEGTRVCGNLGHWIDLPVHFLNWREVKTSEIKIDITYSAEQFFDENMTVTFTTNLGDIISITFTARSEPFEGVYEFVNLQWGDVIAHIEDFRKMKIWKNEKKKTYRYWPKDVGHKSAVMQPFVDEKRKWEELEISTLLMLDIKDMVLNRETSRVFKIKEALDTYREDLN